MGMPVHLPQLQSHTSGSRLQHVHQQLHQCTASICQFGGNVKKIRCDCDTNFVGANNELKAALREIDDEKVQRYLAGWGCEYIFIAPRASQMGGSLGEIYSDCPHYPL